jgi:hypothetical protein
VDGSDEVRLRDGTSLVVCPIRSDDATALVALHARLSADTIYRRYFGVVGETETQPQGDYVPATGKILSIATAPCSITGRS